MAHADSLTNRIDALADALRAAGVSPDRVATILGSAATATMHALVLDAVLEGQAAPALPAVAVAAAAAEHQPIKLAA